MLVLVIVLIVLVVTNLATVGVLAYHRAVPADGPEPDAAAAAALDRSPRPPAVIGGTRRLISVEILNPIELAGTKGRLAGIAGSLVPGLTRRIVYDQTLKILKKQLEDQHVVADVRLHTLQPVSVPPVRSGRSAPPAPAEPPDAIEPEAPVAYTDEVQQVDLMNVGDPDPDPDPEPGDGTTRP